MACSAALLCAGLALLASVSVAAAPVDNTLLPDGTEFRPWDDRTPYSRTYHVAQKTPNASDRNPGTQARPWLTVSRAAEVLQPGQRVIVHSGTYREWVKPARGGEGPDRMIAYMAAPGEDVVMKGSSLWTPRWEPTRDHFVPDSPRTWCARLDGAMFEGANVFCLQNFTIQPDAAAWPALPSFELRRGQLFLDGKPLTQVNTYENLVKIEHAFWVEENGMTIHVRLAKDASPQGKTFEITTREQVFAPTTRALNYIRLSGFRIFHAGNGIPIPPPQRGAVSATAGHHWILEDCEIGYANTIGVDLGGQWWNLVNGDRQGWHIVRRNYIHHCGVSAVEAWHNRPNQSLLVEDNQICDNGSLPITSHYETAGIKVHLALGCLFRRNVFLRNRNSSALWLDGFITNTRITQNVFADTQASPFGSVFIEISFGPNLIDNNVVVGSETHGLYEHDAARIIAAHNLIAGGSGSAVHFNLGAPDRKAGGKHPEDFHRVYGNILQGFERYVWFPNSTGKSDGNLLGGLKPGAAEPFVVQGKPVLDLAAWKAAGNDTQAVSMPLQVTLDTQSLVLKVTAPPGSKLPTWEPPVEVMPEIPPLSELIPPEYPRPVGVERIGPVIALADLLRCDLLGRIRDPGRLQMGPLTGLPLDGTGVKIDPRRPNRWSLAASN
jgi:hypothetical protein